MMIKCAVFDFDGTLFDSMYVWDTAGGRYLRSLGKTPSPTLREDLKPLSLYQAAEYFISEYGLTLTPDEIVAGIDRTVEQAYLNEVLPKAGAEAFLNKLKELGAKLCIATATDRYPIEAALRRCGLEHYFDAIFTCSEVGHGKDEPIIFRRAMEHFAADRGNTLVFEDALYAARTAKEDEFRVVAVYDRSEQQQAELRRICDFCLDSFKCTDEFWKFASAL
ncbi:MAG: HAD family phosphatase [Ruminiclostridium sp.]|nr:HAD family phosphatase [Ruminiclostridium sp.]